MTAVFETAIEAQFFVPYILGLLPLGLTLFEYLIDNINASVE